MDEFTEMDDSRQVTKQKLRQYFDGKIVRKDLTKHSKCSGVCSGVFAGTVLQFQ